MTKSLDPFSHATDRTAPQAGGNLRNQVVTGSVQDQKWRKVLTGLVHLTLIASFMTGIAMIFSLRRTQDTHHTWSVQRDEGQPANVTNVGPAYQWRETPQSEKRIPAHRNDNDPPSHDL